MGFARKLRVFPEPGDVCEGEIKRDVLRDPFAAAGVNAGVPQSTSPDRALVLVDWGTAARSSQLSPSHPVEATFAQLPEQLTLREIQFTITAKGRRVRSVILITTLLDAKTYTRDDLAQRYGIRWQAEIDLRSLKTVLQMDVLRTKTPETVRKEVWTHLLAYNLIRTVIAKAAEAHQRRPTQISFKGALQTINAFREYLLSGHVSESWLQQLLAAIAYHEIGDRPGRYEPRARKRRAKPYKLLQIPRHQARKRLPGKTYD